MDLQSTYHNDINIISVNEARIDASVAIKFKDAMRSLTQTGPDHVVLDLAQVTFVDSSGLGAIVASKKQIGYARQMDLAGLTGDVEKVFRLTRMDSIFEIHSDVGCIVKRQAG